MWNGTWNKLQFKVCQAAQASVVYLDKHRLSTIAKKVNILPRPVPMAKTVGSSCTDPWTLWHGLITTPFTDPDLCFCELRNIITWKNILVHNMPRGRITTINSEMHVFMAQLFYMLCLCRNSLWWSSSPVWKQNPFELKAQGMWNLRCWKQVILQ